MKSVSSWFCFRPVSAVEEPEDSRRRVDGMADGAKVLRSASSLSDTVCYKISDESTRPRVALMRSLSRMIRPGRRVREADEPQQHGFSRKIGRSLSRRIGASFSGKTAPYFDVESKSMRRAKSWRLEAHGTLVESSSLLPFSSSSSRPSMTAAACGRPNPSPVGSGRSEVVWLDPKHAQVRGERPAVVVGWWVQACAFVMILCATVFWGRLFAILLTSTCLYVLPHRSAGGSRRRDPARLPAENKSDSKRVIMEGLLQRNNRPTVRTGN